MRANLSNAREDNCRVSLPMSERVLLRLSH
jgi:hypothetical protein